MGHFHNARKYEAHLLDMHSHDMFAERASMDDLATVHERAHRERWGVPHLHDGDGSITLVGSELGWGGDAS